MKKLISLLLVFSILTISIPLTAKERKGADLIVQKKDGQQVRGELIAVKENSILLLDRDTGADVTVDIEDISVIRILKKSNLLKGAGWGVLSGAVVGASFYMISEGFSYWHEESFIILMALAGIGASIGLVIGGLLGWSAGTDKTIQLEGKSDSEIQEILEKLRKKARVRNSQ